MERLEAALEEARALGLRLGAMTDPGERERLALEYARARAREARRVLITQREAVGLHQHRILDQLFPESPRLPRA